MHRTTAAFSSHQLQAQFEQICYNHLSRWTPTLDRCQRLLTDNEKDFLRIQACKVLYSQVFSSQLLYIRSLDPITTLRFGSADL